MKKINIMTPSRLYDRIGQFTTIPNTVIKMWPALGTDAFILFVYLRYRSDKNDECFPSYDTISQDTGLRRNAIADGARVLIANGLLERRRRFGNSTVYTLRMPTISTTGVLMEQEDHPPLVSQVNDSSITGVPSLVQTVVHKLDSFNQTHLTKEESGCSQTNWVMLLMAIHNRSNKPTWLNNFKEYFEPTYLLSMDDHTYTVACPDERRRAWLAGNGKDTIERALIGVTGEKINIEFVVQP